MIYKHCYIHALHIHMFIKHCIQGEQIKYIFISTGASIIAVININILGEVAFQLKCIFMVISINFNVTEQFSSLNVCLL